MLTLILTTKLFYTNRWVFSIIIFLTGIRKGSSSDSLISERSLESQYSSDSPIGNVTFENAHEKVRRQLHAINRKFI